MTDTAVSPAARRALVLGGGGATGVAWLVGMIQGFADSGIDLRTADYVIGTSAGSIVGSLVANGADPDDMERQVLDTDPALTTEAMAALDFTEILALFAAWEAMPDASPASCQTIGAMALAAKTIPATRFRELLDPEIDAQWPKGAFACTAVDAVSGEFVVLNAAADVLLADAIASSICVPGIFPPVEVNGRHLVDGGLRSGTNADLAVGYDRVIVLAPIGSRLDGMDVAANRAALAEIAGLEAAGTVCTLLFPDDVTNDVIGIDRMNVAISAAVIAEGRRHGGVVAATLAGTW